MNRIEFMFRFYRKFHANENYVPHSIPLSYNRVNKCNLFYDNKSSYDVESLASISLNRYSINEKPVKIYR